MSCISRTARRAQLEADLARVNDQITRIETAIEGSFDNAEVEMYRFDSGEGWQQTRRRSPEELFRLLERLESRRNWIQRKLCQGGGLVNMNVRRKQGYYRGRIGGRG